MHEALTKLAEALQSHGLPPIEERRWRASFLSLARAGVLAYGGRGNRVYVAEGSGFRSRVAVQFSGTNNTVFVAGARAKARLLGNIRIKGNNCTVFIGRMDRWRNRIKVTVKGDNCLFHLGDDGTVVGGEFHLSEDRSLMLFGDGCMFADEVYVRNSDGHGVFDSQSGTRLNSPRDLVVGPRVWLAQRAMLLKAGPIGHDSIIGAGSVVTGSVPSNSIAAGCPAHVMRTGVTWDRDLAPTISYRRSSAA